MSRLISQAPEKEIPALQLLIKLRTNEDSIE